MEDIKTKRIDEFDMIKGLLIAFIVLRHLREMSGIDVYGPSFLEIFHTYSEAILLCFVLISGYCYKQKETVLKDIKHRFKTIMVPTLIATTFFAAIYFIKYCLIDSQSFMLWLNNMLCNYVGLIEYNFFLPTYVGNSMQYASVPYWYLYELFSAYIIFIPLYKLIKDKKLITKFITFILLLIFIMFLYKIDIQNGLVDAYSTPWPYSVLLINIFGFAAILLLGTILKEINMFSIISKPIIKWSVFVCASIIIVYTFLDYGCHYIFQYGLWGAYGIWSIPVTTIVAVCLLYCLFVLFNILKENKFIKSVFSFLGKNSMYFLLLHLGFAEIVAWVFGFWYDVYVLSEPYPIELYASWHFLILLPLVFGGITCFILIKHRLKKRGTI